MSLQARQALGLVATLLAEEDWRSSASGALERSHILRTIDEVCSDAARSIRGQIQIVLSSPERREFAIACLRRLPLARGLDDLHDDLARVRCPALILAAEGDPIHPFGYARRIAQCFPDCELVEIEPKTATDEARHLQEVDRNIGDFLRSKLPFQASTGGLALKRDIELGGNV